MISAFYYTTTSIDEENTYFRSYWDKSFCHLMIPGSSPLLFLSNMFSTFLNFVFFFPFIFCSFTYLRCLGYIYYENWGGRISLVVTEAYGGGWDWVVNIFFDISLGTIDRWAESARTGHKVVVNISHDSLPRYEEQIRWRELERQY